MSILADGFKVIKQNNGDVVLFDYQVNSNNNVTICTIELGEKKNKLRRVAIKNYNRMILKGL